MNNKNIHLACVQINPIVGDLNGNAEKIQNKIKEAANIAKERSLKDVLVVFPECALSGYPLEDMTLNEGFIDSVEEKIQQIVEYTEEHKDIGVLFGTPIRNIRVNEIRKNSKGNEIQVMPAPYNGAVLAENGQIINKFFKHELPNHDVFDEERTFTRQNPQPPIFYKGFKIGVQICEDIWHNNVSEYQKSFGVDFFICINGSPYETHKYFTRSCAVVPSKRVPTIYLNLVGGQDEIVFDGCSFLTNPANIGRHTETIFVDKKFGLAFQEDMTFVNAQRLENDVVFLVPDKTEDFIDDMELDYHALVTSIKDYVHKNGFKGVIIGNSGGIDSALTMAIAADALSSENVMSFQLPYNYTSKESLEDSKEVAINLGVNYNTIPIHQTVNVTRTAVEDTILKTGEKLNSLTVENLQAQARGLFLMTISRQTGYLLLTTGNKSEISVGYSTLYGDMCGGFNALKDVFKTKVFQLAEWRNKNVRPWMKVQNQNVIPTRIITKPPSAELAPDQKDENELPPYEVLDLILEYLIDLDQSVENTVRHLRKDEELVFKIKNMLDRAEYKRRQAAPGPKISPRNFGRGRRWPIVMKFRG